MKLDDVKVIFVDIDDTITAFESNYNAQDYKDEIFSLFAFSLAEKSGTEASEAKREIYKYADDIIWWDYQDFIADFDLPAMPVWDAIRQIHQKRLSVYNDAVEMVKKMHHLGKNMCIISNNPITGCLLKLEIAGLADLRGSKFFPRIFGTNVTRGLKSQPQVWKRAISSLGVLPSEILTIGDSEKEDFKIPQSVGIEHTVIINRRSKIKKEKNGKYLRVNSLKNII